MGIWINISNTSYNIGYHVNSFIFQQIKRKTNCCIKLFDCKAFLNKWSQLEEESLSVPGSILQQ